MKAVKLTPRELVEAISAIRGRRFYLEALEPKPSRTESVTILKSAEDKLVMAIGGNEE